MSGNSDDTTKSGARHSSSDMTLGRKVKAMAGDIANHMDALGFTDEPAPVEWTPAEQDKALINFGFDVKAMGDGRIGGYAVRWGSEAEPDLSRAHDWFHEKTYFGANAGNGVDVTINHGIPLKDTNDPEEAKVFDEIAQHLLPPVKTKIDKIGLFAETVTDLADQFDAMVYTLAEKGKLRWSTGAVGHLVKRTAMPNGTNRIDQWIIGEIALTPTPAEPRLGNVLPLKAYVESLQPAEQPAPKGAQEHSTAPLSAVVQPKQEIKTMPEEVQTQPMPDYVKAKLDEVLAAVVGIKKEVDAMKSEAPIHEGGVAGIIDSGKAPSVRTIKETYAQEQVNTLKAYLANEIGLGDWKAHNREVAKHDADLNQAFKNLTHAQRDGGRAEAAYTEAMKASMVEGTASLGGNLVPQLYGNRLVGKLKEASIVRQSGAYQFPVSGGYKFQVPTITRSGSAPIASELGAASQMEPTFSTVDFTAYAYRAQYIASREQVLDSRIPLDEILMDNAAWQFTQSENNHFAIGTGSGQPSGIAAAASVSAASPGSTLAIAFASASGSDNVYDLYHSLPYQYRDGAVWFANDLTIKAIRKIRTGGGGAASLGDYFWQAGGANGVPDRLLGKPIYPLNNMYTSGSAAGSLQGALVIANMDFFWIADFYNGGLDFQVLNELYAASAAIGWWFWKRMDSHLVVSEAAQGLALR